MVFESAPLHPQPSVVVFDKANGQQVCNKFILLIENHLIQTSLNWQREKVYTVLSIFLLALLSWLKIPNTKINFPKFVLLTQNAKFSSAKFVIIEPFIRENLFREK